MATTTTMKSSSASKPKGDEAQRFRRTNDQDGEAPTQLGRLDFEPSRGVWRGAVRCGAVQCTTMSEFEFEFSIAIWQLERLLAISR